MTAFVAWIKRHATTLTVVALVAVAAAGIYRVEDLANENRVLIDRANNETISRQVDDCRAAREFRQTFPNILRQLANPPTAVNADIDFTQVPGFDDLDPATQTYLATLGAVLSASGGGSSEFLIETARRYERDFPVPDCTDLKHELEVKLKAQRGDGS
jgi:hypothetical protein